jgi:hypothetical protein
MAPSAISLALTATNRLLKHPAAPIFLPLGIPAGIETPEVADWRA